jgi:hypothetical protein
MIDICRAFDLFSPIRAPETTFDTCFQFILEASHLTDGFTWIIQAVRSKLMLAMRQCARQATEVIDELAITMVKVLMSFSGSRYCILGVAASRR